MIHEMQFLRLIGPKSVFLSTVEILFQLNCFHPTAVEITQNSDLQQIRLSADDQEKRETTLHVLTELRALLDLLALKPKTEYIDQIDKPDLEEIQTGINIVRRQLNEFFEKRQNLVDTLNLLPLYEKKLKKLLPHLPETVKQSGYGTISLFTNQLQAEALRFLQEEIQILTEDSAELFQFDLDRDTKVLLVICQVKYLGGIESWLKEENFPRFELPDGVNTANPFTALSILQERIKVLPDLIKAVDAEIETIKEQHANDLFDWIYHLNCQSRIYKLIDLALETNYIFLIQGWVPKAQADEFKSAITARVGESFVFDFADTPADLKKEIPVLMENVPLVKPFEQPVRLYAAPQYNDFDPSGLMAFFLPLFFGMILGDIGYGLVLLGLSLVLARKFNQPTFRDILKILRLGSLWTIVFGVLYGEFLGTLGEKIGLHPIWLDRADRESLIPLMITVIGLGAVHITLGLVLGAWRAVLDKNRKHLLERGGMLIGLVGLFLFAGVLANLIPDVFRIPAVSILVIGIVMLGFSIGKFGFIVGPIEFIGLIGNILSYIRIAAVGLSSVYLAKVANDLAGFFGSLVVGVIIAVLFHALNLVIGTFSPSIHSLRLMYVEFFRKFYHGGGQPFRPFGPDY